MWAVVELGLGFVGTIVLFSALQASRSSDIRMGAGLLGGVFLNDLALPSDLDFAHSLANGGCTPDTPGSPEGNTEGPGTASSEPLLPS